jgi:ATP-dependent Clp protease ATP-binding subunit ClpA
MKTFVIQGESALVGEIGLTRRSKKVIELAVDEARLLDHHYIGTEHLLLGIIREGDGLAVGVLESLGVDLGKVRTKTLQVLNAPSEETKSVLAEDKQIITCSSCGTLCPASYTFCFKCGNQLL